MILWHVILSFLCGVILTALWWWVDRKTDQRKPKEVVENKININLQDIISLASLNTSMDVSALIIEHEIHTSNPDFYAKYRALNKQEKELYFNELIDILSKNRREYVRDLFDKYPKFNNQDVLLLLMCQMQVDNKTKARVLGLPLETLKKRQTRLKEKMQVEEITA